MATTYKGTIQRLPACTDWKGNQYPACFGVTITEFKNGCPFWRFDGGEYATEQEARAAIAKAEGRA